MDLNMSPKTDESPEGGATPMSGGGPVPSVDGAHKAARARAEALQGLYVHLLVYAVVNGGLFLINALTRDGGSWWFQWPLFGWGLGLMIHVLVTAAPVFSPDWVERRTERIVSRHPGT
jgi:2TM domain